MDKGRAHLKYGNDSNKSLRRATKLAREPSSLSYKGLKDVTRKRDAKVDDDADDEE